MVWVLRTQSTTLAIDEIFGLVMPCPVSDQRGQTGFSPVGQYRAVSIREADEAGAKLC